MAFDRLRPRCIWIECLPIVSGVRRESRIRELVLVPSRTESAGRYENETYPSIPVIPELGKTNIEPDTKSKRSGEYARHVDRVALHERVVECVRQLGA